jgi:hypothetical protein
VKIVRWTGNAREVERGLRASLGDAADAPNATRAVTMVTAHLAQKLAERTA